MKHKLIIALIINIALLIHSARIFITNGIMEKIIHWKFIASLFGVIIFGIFVFLIIRQLKRQ
jgi:uncharacterized protein YhhL (DUF1145 family)